MPLSFYRRNNQQVSMWRLICFAIVLLATSCELPNEAGSKENTALEDGAEKDSVTDLAPAASLSPVEIAEKTFPSVVLLVMHDQNGQPVSIGSGFFVDKDIIATNLHVVEGAAKGYAKLVGQEENHEIEGALAVDSKRDLALLRTSELAEPLNLDSARLNVGSEVYAIGNPRGLEGTFSEGIVSGVRKFEGDEVLQITAPISPGSSGGPVLNPQGDVIGVATATFKSGQNLNFAVPAQYVLDLLAESPNLKSLSIAGNSSSKSVFANTEEPSETVTADQFLWSTSSTLESIRNQKFTFSIRNHGNRSIRNVWVLVIFHDDRGQPIESKLLSYGELVPPKLAKRASGNVDYSIKKLTTSKRNYGYDFRDEPYTEVEFRILNFEVVQQ